MSAPDVVAAPEAGGGWNLRNRVRRLRPKAVQVVAERFRGRLLRLASVQNVVAHPGGVFGATFDPASLRLGAALLRLMLPPDGVLIAADWPARAWLAVVTASARRRDVLYPLHSDAGGRLHGPPPPRGASALVFAALVDSGASLTQALEGALRAGLVIHEQVIFVDASPDGNVSPLVSPRRTLIRVRDGVARAVVDERRW